MLIKLGNNLNLPVWNLVPYNSVTTKCSTISCSNSHDNSAIYRQTIQLLCISHAISLLYCREGCLLNIRRCNIPQQPALFNLFLAIELTNTKWNNTCTLNTTKFKTNNDKKSEVHCGSCADFPHNLPHKISEFIKKNPTRCNNVPKFYYSIFRWSSTCFRRHTAHHREPETALAASGFSYMEGCWTCSWWTLSGTVCPTTSIHEHKIYQKFTFSKRCGLQTSILLL
jgi:hypothetical protein